MPHDYAELIARLREHPAFMIGGPAADAAMIALLREAATALARLSAPVTEEEVEAAAEAIETLAIVGFQENQPKSAREMTRRIARAALAAHRAGRGM